METVSIREARRERIAAEIAELREGDRILLVFRDGEKSGSQTGVYKGSGVYRAALGDRTTFALPTEGHEWRLEPGRYYEHLVTIIRY